jgi:hypothetical protein
MERVQRDEQKENNNEVPHEDRQVVLFVPSECYTHHAEEPLKSPQLAREHP